MVVAAYANGFLWGQNGKADFSLIPLSNPMSPRYLAHEIGIKPRVEDRCQCMGYYAPNKIVIKINPLQTITVRGFEKSRP